MNSGITDHVCWEEVRHVSCNEMKILGKEEQWRIRCLKESTYMLDYHDILITPRIEINKI